MFSMTDRPVQTKPQPPCPSWCHKHWPADAGRQHQSVGIRFATGFVSLERLDTAITEGPVAISIERADDGETLTIAAADLLSLVTALVAVSSAVGP